MRVVGAGVGGLASAVAQAHAAHDVMVAEQTRACGGKAGRWESEGSAFDTSPSLLTMPRVFEELFASTCAPLGDSGVELMRVEPGTRYRFADGSRSTSARTSPRRGTRSRRRRRAPAATGLGSCARARRCGARRARSSQDRRHGRRAGPRPALRRRIRATSCACDRGTRLARSRARTRKILGCGW
jgi:phytoene dehydrogenase-like protein